MEIKKTKKKVCERGTRGLIGMGETIKFLSTVF